MGAYLNTFVGPYIRLTCRKEDGFDEYKTCIKIGCDYHFKRLRGRDMENKFCAECGIELEMTKVPEVKTISYLDWLYSNKEIESEFRDDLTRITFSENELEQYLMSNTSDNIGDYLQYDGALEHDPDVVEESTSKFKDEFKKIISGLTDFFGEENVAIKWGTIIYHI